jgi:hypothetical protein
MTWQATNVGHTAGSFAIGKDGEYRESGTSQRGLCKGPFVNGDVIGCGVVVAIGCERCLFFTKNGVIWGAHLMG